MRPSFFHVTTSFPVHRYFSPPPVTQTKPPYHHTTAYAEIMHGPYTFSVVFIKPYMLNHAKSILLFSIMLFRFFLTDLISIRVPITMWNWMEDLKLISIWDRRAYLTKKYLIWSNIRRKRTIIISRKNKKTHISAIGYWKNPWNIAVVNLFLSLSLAWKILTDFIYSTLAELRALLFSSYFNLQRNHNLYVFTFLSFTFLFFIYFYLIHLCHAMCHFIVMHFLSMLLIYNSGFCLRLVC